jgi:hypothetical protein
LARRSFEELNLNQINQLEDWTMEMQDCICSCCPAGKTPKKFLVTGVSGVSNSFCQSCEGFNQDWVLFHIHGCTWNTCNFGPCTAGPTMALTCDGETWVLGMGPLLSSAAYTLPASEFNCLGANTMQLVDEGDDCVGWPETLTVTAMQG